MLSLALALTAADIDRCKMVTTTEAVSVKPGMQYYALEYYKRGWTKARRAAVKSGNIADFEMQIANFGTDDVEILLTTRYKDRAQFEAREENFQRIFKELGFDGPLTVYGKARAEFAQTRYGAVNTVSVFLPSGSCDVFQNMAAAQDTSLGADFPYAFFEKPTGPGPHPAIIVLGGSEGGDEFARSKVKPLTDEGFAVLGLPYYLADSSPLRPEFPLLPGTFNAIPVERVEAAKAWLQQRSDIRPDDIGVYGVSKGAELALLSGTLVDGFGAIAAIVPSDVVWEGWGTGVEPGTASSFSWRGEPLAFVAYQGLAEEFAAAAKEGRRPRYTTPHDQGRHADPSAVSKARIPVETIDEPVFVAGGDADTVWNSGEMAQNIAERRAEAGLTTVSLVFLDAGHFLSGTGDGSDGASQADIAAQKRVWPATLKFFRDTLMD